MLLCVIGHISLSDYGNLQFPIVRIIHLFIYTFHMPMFIILNGYFFKKEAAKRKFVLYLLMCFVFRFFLTFINYTFKYQNYYFKFIWIGDYYWTFFVLAVYNIILYFLDNYDKLAILTVSIMLSLIIGFDKSAYHDFAIQRCFVFFPYFLIGVLFKNNNYLYLINMFIKKTILIKLFSFFVLVFYITIIIIYQKYGIFKLISFFFGCRPYYYTGINNYLFCVLIRFLTYLLTIFVGFSFCVLIPQFKINPISYFGQRTDSVYFWHGILCRILNGFKLLYITSYYKLLFLIIISIIVTLIFSSNIFKFPLINSLKFIKEE